MSFVWKLFFLVSSIIFCFEPAMFQEFTIIWRILCPVCRSSVSRDTEAIKVTFYSFKHHYNEPPLSVVLTRQPVVCPVDTLLVYLQFRGCRPGPIFQHLDGSPVIRSEFCDWLARAIKSCGLNPDRYKGHSFYIGAASHAAECGYSETQIRLLGQWKSGAFKKYIRLPSLQSTPTCFSSPS